MKKLIVALLISCIGVAATPNISYALKTGDIWSMPQPRYTVISSRHAFIDKNGSKLTLNASLISRTATNLKIQMNLQEHVDGRWWTIKTWNKSIQSTRLSDIKSYQGVSGRTYRLYTKFTAGSEVTSSYAY